MTARRLANAVCLVVPAAALTLSVRWSLRRRGFARTLERFGGPSPAPRWIPRVPRRDAGYGVVRLVGRALPGRDSCLVRSLVHARILAWSGFRPVLSIAARVDGDHAFGAHAWVAVDGIVVAEKRGDFTPLLEVVVGAA